MVRKIKREASKKGEVCGGSMEVGRIKGKGSKEREMGREKVEAHVGGESGKGGKDK